MGWSSIVSSISSAWSKGGFKLGSKLGEGLKGLSSAFSNIKWSSIFKVGAAGGIGYTIYHAWDSATGSIADATGLSQDNVQTILFFGIGLVVVYLAVVYLTDRKTGGGGSSVVIQYPEERRRSRYDDYKQDGYDGSARGYSRSYQSGYQNRYSNRYQDGYDGRFGGGRR